MQTVKSALEELTASMDRIDAQVIMAEVLGVNRAWIAANPMRILTESEDAKIDMLATQRALGEPIAYLLRRREFYGRDFTVNADVLIPRPETETLVEAALARLAPRDTVLDLGTGSGAIAVTLACQRPEARVVATDASEAALAVARANAARHGCDGRIEWLHGSWYEPVGERRFDLVVANPPYVAAGDPHLSRGDLRFEPRAAPHRRQRRRARLHPRHRGRRARATSTPAGGSSSSTATTRRRPRARCCLKRARPTPISLPDLAGIPRVAGGKIA